MTIRKAEYQDAKRLNFLLTLLIRDERQYNPEINEDFVVTNMYENYIDDDKRIILVAEEDDKIIGYLYGFIVLSDEVETGRIANLDALYVEEDYRKHGVAEKLIDQFKVWVLNNKINAVKVQSSAMLSAREWRSSAVSLLQFRHNGEFPTRAVFLKCAYKTARCRKERVGTLRRQ